MRAAFKGSSSDLNGHVFECFHEQSDHRQFKKTMEALDEYSKKTLRYSKDMAPLFADTINILTINKPGNLPADANQTQALIWNEEVKEYVKGTWTMQGNLATVYAVAWGECSKAIKAKIKSLQEYEA
jgi:hypothetical protein